MERGHKELQQEETVACCSWAQRIAGPTATPPGSCLPSPPASTASTQSQRCSCVMASHARAEKPRVRRMATTVSANSVVPGRRLGK